MIIYGAGLAGLLAGNMLRGFDVEVHEAQKDLPNNHGALLRFRTDKVGTACAIPFKKVRVHKAIKYDDKIHTTPNLQLSNLYSQKVTGAILSRSINNLDPSDRFIAPWELIKMMASNCKMRYGMSLSKSVIERTEQPIISTIPMPTLMKIIGWEDIPEFPHQQIWTQKGTILDPECNVYQTIYYPDPKLPFYRVSIKGNIIISEFVRKPESIPGPHLMEVLKEDFGIRAYKIHHMEQSNQLYGKIRPIDEDLRKQFIFEMTTKYGIYALGRFATWRQLLLDDVVEDCQHIERFIRGSSGYTRLMHNQKGMKA